MIKKEQIKAMGKGQLKELVKPYSKKYTTPIINETIARERNISLESAKKEKIVSQKEAKIIVDFLGFEYEKFD